MNTGKKRVVVTGLGAITPIGNTVGEFWTSIRAGVGGVETITRFDPSRLDCRVAAQVKDFAAGKHVDPKEARRMALFTQYGWRPRKWRGQTPAWTRGAVIKIARP